ncbi:MAG: adenylosuccinate lyase [Elusimicrobia bacterium]|nr:adenylosuccinate lyase [Elusimicrobiota bacterium]
MTNFTRSKKMIDRYILPQMKKVWSEENYFEKLKEVEVAALFAAGEKQLAAKLEKVTVKLGKIRKIEKKNEHEINAFLEFLEGEIGRAAGKIHKGMTSSDVLDTARALQMREALKIIEEKLSSLEKILRNKALKYRRIVMAGRTHGQFAEPITLGLKFVLWFDEMRRNHRRLEEMKKRIFVGKISGACGTYSLVSPSFEKKVLKALNLKPITSNQVVQRDIHAEYFFVLSLICATAGKIAQEVRLLSQDGIKELGEPFMKTQTGSSAMPHKRNPVIAERVCGLARLAGAFVPAALSNVALWNERDISHSSNERIMFEEASALTDYILSKIIFIVGNLVVFKENIRRNLDEASARIYSSAVLKYLLDFGLSRVQAYRIAKNCFAEAFTKEEVFEFLKKRMKVDKEKIFEIMSPEYYLRNADEIFRRVFGRK